MKSLLLAAALAALALPPPHSARPTSDRSPSRARRPKPLSFPPNTAGSGAGEFDNLQGSYDLSNGDTMAMTKRMNRKFIKVGDRPQVEVIAAGDYDFVSLDEKYRVVLSEPRQRRSDRLRADEDPGTIARAVAVPD